MALANSFSKVASKVLNKFGGNVIVRYVGAGAYNSATGTVSESITNAEVPGVLHDVSLREVNELVQASDKRLTVAAADLPSAPKPKDRVVINAVVYEVVRVGQEELDNMALVYELILRA